MRAALRRLRKIRRLRLPGYLACALELYYRYVSHIHTVRIAD